MRQNKEYEDYKLELKFFLRSNEIAKFTVVTGMKVLQLQVTKYGLMPILLKRINLRLMMKLFLNISARLLKNPLQGSFIFPIMRMFQKVALKFSG